MGLRLGMEDDGMGRRWVEGRLGREGGARTSQGDMRRLLWL